LKGGKLAPELISPSSHHQISAQNQISPEDVDLSEVKLYDTTGMFHWCQGKDVEEVVITRVQANQMDLRGHVIVCLFAEPQSPLIGLRNFVMPLRASNFYAKELRTIVLLGNLDYIQREWKSLKNFPRIFVMNGNPLNRADLRSVHINSCAECVILSAKRAHGDQDSTMSDKEAILCSLNIKAMVFETEDEVQNPNILNRHKATTEDLPEIFNGDCIPMITELVNDGNVQFLDQDDEDDPDTELYITQPFACGTAFAVSVLDSLMSTTYFNDNALTLIRTLITGGATPELEHILAEGVGMQGSTATPEILANRRRCRVSQMDLQNGPFHRVTENGTYGNLFVHALRNYSMLCIGLYRLRDNPNIFTGSSSSKRYVICNPPDDFPLYLSDKVYCLQPFETAEQFFTDVPLIDNSMTET